MTKVALIIVMVIAAIIILMAFKQNVLAPVEDSINDGSPDKGTICTQEARQCPDGSYVGRQGPRCEFAPCPTP